MGDEKDLQIEALRQRLEVLEQAYNGTLRANQGLREALRTILNDTREQSTAHICREALITQ